MRSRRKYNWIHAAAWLAVYGYMIIGTFLFPQDKLERSSPGYVSILHTSYFMALLATFYFCYSLVLPGFLKKKFVAPAVVGAIASPFVFVLIRGLLEEVLYPALFGFRNYGENTTIDWYIVDNIFRGLPVIAVSGVVWGAEQAYYKEQENRQLRDEKVKAELAFLKTQINPHFLFNTLNYMYSLAYPVSEKLGNAVIRLSQLMRYMLAETGDHTVPLQKEVEYINNYIEVYRMLFEGQLYIDYTITGDVEKKAVAPLLLIPFFENAFKHGIVNDSSKPVTARLRVNEKGIDFMLKNAINKYQKDHSSGIGLANVKRRLELLYPGKHSLVITDNGTDYETKLSITL